MQWRIRIWTKRYANRINSPGIRQCSDEKIVLSNLNLNSIPTASLRELHRQKLQTRGKSWILRACCNLVFLDMLQVVKTFCVKLVDKKSWKSTCNKPVDNLQKTCYHQAGANDANASWYRLDDCKVTSLQQTCCNLRGFGCALLGRQD